MAAQIEPVAAADASRPGEILHNALKSFDVLIADPNQAYGTPAGRWKILKTRLLKYASDHGYDAEAQFYGDFNLRLNRADPADKTQTYMKLNNLLLKIQNMKLCLEMPSELQLSMSNLEGLDYRNEDDREVYVDAIYNNINLDIIALETYGSF